MDITPLFVQKLAEMAIATRGVSRESKLKKKTDNMFSQAKRIIEDITEIKRCILSRRTVPDYFFSVDCVLSSDPGIESVDSQIEAALIRCKKFVKSFQTADVSSLFNAQRTTWLRRSLEFKKYSSLSSMVAECRDIHLVPAKHLAPVDLSASGFPVEETGQSERSRSSSRQPKTTEAGSEEPSHPSRNQSTDDGESCASKIAQGVRQRNRPDLPAAKPQDLAHSPERASTAHSNAAPGEPGPSTPRRMSPASQSHARRTGLAREPQVVYSPVAAEEDDVLAMYLPTKVEELKKENEMLYKSFTTKHSEIQSVEKKIEEIARLQNVFAEKVMEQTEDIQRIGENAAETHENVVTANDLIREAIKHKAALRVWILFFLIVMTFTLFFLDWYNP